MLVLTEDQIGKGWREVTANNFIQTFDQYYNYTEGAWFTGSFFTSEKFLHRGKVPYRRPASFQAYLVALPGFILKVWRRKIVLLFKKN